jgi:hypothetical protein
MATYQERRLNKIRLLERQLEEHTDYKSIISNLKDAMDKGNFCQADKQKIHNAIDFFESIPENKQKLKLENELQETVNKYTEVEKRRESKLHDQITMGQEKHQAEIDRCSKINKASTISDEMSKGMLSTK